MICEAVVTITTTAGDRRWQKWWSLPPVIDCPPYENSGSQKSPFCHTFPDRYTTNGHHLHRNRVPWSPNALSFFLPSFVCFLFNKTAAGQGNVPVSKMARTFNHNCRRRCCDQSNWQELLNRFCRRLFVWNHTHLQIDKWQQQFSVVLCILLHFYSPIESFYFQCLFVQQRQRQQSLLILAPLLWFPSPFDVCQKNTTTFTYLRRFYLWKWW